MSVEEIKAQIIPILKKHGVKRAGLFGSVARGEATDESDVDVLVEVKDDYSLLDFIGIKLDLEDQLGKTVDLVEYDAIKPRLKPYILKDHLAIL